MLPLTLYRFVGHLLEPLLSPRLSSPRKGFLPRADLWLHAASVGEATVAAAIIKALQERFSGAKILLTLQTHTGLAKARELLREDIALSPAPLDFPSFVKRAFECVKPRVLALVETELWPNLILEAQRHRVLLVTVNGRLSQKAYRRYRLSRRLWRELFRNFWALGVIGPLEAKRFEALGAPKKRLRILGNAKYDLLYQRKAELQLEEARKKLPFAEKILTFGSVRGGEEKEILKAIALLLKKFPGKIRIALAPRHLKLLKKLEKGLRERGIPYTRWSLLPTREAPVILIDAIGPLLKIYALSFAAFVGGSLIPKGGQNPLEPALFKRPLLFGPYMTNFPYEAEALKKACGDITVNNGEEIFEMFSFWLENPEEARATGEKAFRVLEGFLGASANYAKLLHEALLSFPP